MNRLLTTTALATVLALGGAGAAMAQGQTQGQQHGGGQQGQEPYRRAETPGRPAVPNSDVEYSKSMERLFQAAQRLREAVQAMAQQPAGEQRNRAMDTAREALLETQQAMTQVASVTQSSSGSSGSNASSSGAASSGGSSGSQGGGHSGGSSRPSR